MGAAAMAALFYFTAWAREPAPAISVDNTPIVRDAKAVTSYAPVVKKAAPSVVNIFPRTSSMQRLYRNPMFNDPLFRQFFGDPSGQRRRQSARNHAQGGKPRLRDHHFARMATF